MLQLSSAGAGAISQLSFQIHPGATFKRRSTREKYWLALSVIRARRQTWGMRPAALPLTRHPATPTSTGATARKEIAA